MCRLFSPLVHSYNGPPTPTVQIPARYRFSRFSDHKCLLDVTKVRLGSTRFTVPVFKSSSHFGPGASRRFNGPDTWRPLRLNKLAVIISTLCRLVWSASGHVCIVGDSSQHILIYSVSNIHLFPRNFHCDPPCLRIIASPTCDPSNCTRLTGPVGFATRC